MLMKPYERNKEIQQMLTQMYDLAIAQPTSNTPCEEEIERIVAAKEPSYREVLSVLLPICLLILSWKRLRIGMHFIQEVSMIKVLSKSF